MNRAAVHWTQNIHVPGADKALGRDQAYFRVTYDVGGLVDVTPHNLDSRMTTATHVHKWAEGLQAVAKFIDRVNTRRMLNGVDYIQALISLEADEQNREAKS